MIYRNSPESRSGALKSKIHSVEERMQGRRSSIKTATSRIAKGIREQITSPATLVTAGLLGAVLHRGQRPDGAQLIAFLQAANTGLRILLSASPGHSESVE